MIDISPEDATLKTFILFVQTARAVLKYADAHLYRESGLSVVKFIVLQGLASNSGGMTPSEIAEWTQTERHNITTLVDRMRRDRLITTEHNSSDKRLLSITLTEKGREVLSQSMPVAKEVVDKVMLSITDGDSALLEKPLRVLRQNAYKGLEVFVNRIRS